MISIMIFYFKNTEKLFFLFIERIDKFVEIFAG